MSRICNDHNNHLEHFHPDRSVILIVGENCREDFYMHIAEASSGEWTHRSRLPWFSYTDGPFTLAMRSWGDTIPWEVVHEIANRLWMCAASGVPYLFDLAYAAPDGKIIVSITLRLAAQAVSNAIASGSGSDSLPDGSTSNSQSATPNWAFDPNALPGQEDWREGSVPSVNTGDPPHRA
ncbi:MAG: hypothetical protein Q9220_000872 [cf. Caloplaca sp. 1 TL-2023]